MGYGGVHVRECRRPSGSEPESGALPFAADDGIGVGACPPHHEPLVRPQGVEGQTLSRLYGTDAAIRRAAASVVIDYGVGREGCYVVLRSVTLLSVTNRSTAGSGRGRAPGAA